MTTLPVALTCGEPSGAGLELSLLAWQRLSGKVPFFLIADRRHLAALPTDVPVIEITAPGQANAVYTNGLPLLHHDFAAENQFGHPDPANAKCVIGVIERAVQLVQSGQASAICTNPIHKKALKVGAGFAYPGHTEFLAALAGIDRPVMMLAAPELRVVPVTIHVALTEVAQVLTAGLLEDTIRITHADMGRRFGLTTPRIAVAGLNPHAGEGGSMGHEEITLIAPVLDKLRAEGMNLTGPLSADTMFHPEARAGYDVAICMYHDQALIPLKTLNFHGGTNITLGLPFVRTSPDHGTALDIAGQGRANPSSLMAALMQAGEMAAR